MAKSGRENRDDRLAWLLANGLSPAQAGKKLGIPQRTVRRRAKLPHVEAKRDEIRREWLGRATALMTRGSTLAARRLIDLMSSPSDQVALGATKTFLELGLKFRESLDLQARIDAIEARLNDQNGGANLGEVGATSDDDQPGEDPSESDGMGG